MNLNLPVIRDWLTDFPSRIQEADPDLQLTGVRLYEPGQAMDAGILTVARARDFHPEAGPRVVCLARPNCLWLETTDADAVVRRIQEAFSFYDGWYTGCVRAIEGGCTLEDLLNLAKPVLPMPLMLLNTAQSLAAASVSLEDLISMEGEDPAKPLVSIPEEKLMALNQEYNASFFSPKAFLISRGFFPTDAYCCHIFSPDLDRLGTLILKITEGNPSESTQFLLQQFVSLVDLWRRTAEADAGPNPLVSYFARVLEGKRESGRQFARQIALLGWDPEARKRMWVLACPQGKFPYSFRILQMLCLPDLGVQAFPYQNHLIVLQNRDLADDRTFRIRLHLVLGKEDLFAAESCFTDLNDLVKTYLRTRTILEFSPKTPGTPYTCADVAFSLGETRARASVRKAPLHPAVPVLKKQDKLNGSEFYETLFAYLRNESALLPTAQDLHITRLALLHRMATIKEFLQIDPDDPKERTYLLFSYYLDQLSGDPDTPDLHLSWPEVWPDNHG